MLDQHKYFNAYFTESVNERTINSELVKLYPDVISQYEVPDTQIVADFYIPSLKVIIEVNGPSHYIKCIDNNQIVVS